MSRRFEQGFGEGNEPHSLGRVVCVHETDRAILVVEKARGTAAGEFDDMDDEAKKTWVPKSVIHDDSEVKEKDDEGELFVFDWWGRKNGE